MGYPANRPQFFMNAFVKALRDNRVSTALGDDAYRLLIAVVCREDDTGYRRAVQFFNVTLMYEAGIRSEDTLARARKRLVDAGWLVYVPGQKRGPGTYFVRVPDAAVVTAKQRIQAQDVESVTDGGQEVGGLFAGHDAGHDAGHLRGMVRDSCGANRSPSAEPSSHTHTQREDWVPSEPGGAPHAPADRQPTQSSDKKKTKKTAAGVVPAKPVNPRHKPAVDRFCLRWSEVRGGKYPFKKRDAADIETILSHVGNDLDRFNALVERFLADPDDFLVRTGYPPKSLVLRLPAYLATAPPPPATPAARGGGWMSKGERSDADVLRYAKQALLDAGPGAAPPPPQPLALGCRDAGPVVDPTF